MLALPPFDHPTEVPVISVKKLLIESCEYSLGSIDFMSIVLPEPTYRIVLPNFLRLDQHLPEGCR